MNSRVWQDVAGSVRYLSRDLNCLSAHEGRNQVGSDWRIVQEIRAFDLRRSRGQKALGLGGAALLRADSDGGDDERRAGDQSYAEPQGYSAESCSGF